MEEAVADAPTGSERLANVLPARLTHHVGILAMNGDSYPQLDLRLQAHGSRRAGCQETRAGILKSKERSETSAGIGESPSEIKRLAAICSPGRFMLSTATRRPAR